MLFRSSILMAACALLACCGAEPAGSASGAAADELRAEGHATSLRVRLESVTAIGEYRTLIFKLQPDRDVACVGVRVRDVVFLQSFVVWHQGDDGSWGEPDEFGNCPKPMPKRQSVSAGGAIEAVWGRELEDVRPLRIGFRVEVEGQPIIVKSDVITEAMIRRLTK